ncbi:MAG: sulfotransferase [Rudaea sp.]|uniref:sulfotransferase family protein n=1 Tax=unclassified Rudaea TaxID=2627037 RepID=UPI0010F687A5|nr:MULTISPECIES: sulfotransferase [unclassified Rudaea]MBN8886614.1 sulfotransferase [Rudaea sp.]MBR0344309.1 sulfotransferase [Rudaea sp.]
MNRSAVHPLRFAPAPIFIVGSPRSGTSILTWCLGQHSNLLALEESGWMGDFAADVGARHKAGSRRGERSQLAAIGVERDAFIAEFGVAIDNLIFRHRPGSPAGYAADAKTRWIDGTPEYSLHICGLRKLFPAAKFLHIVRDVDDVAASMLNFHRIGGVSLVADAAQAYAYWSTTVGACVAAERALGGEVVHRLRYADLVERPEATLREVCEFLDEPYEACCREPLRMRINSSNVPADFAVDTARVDADALRAARELSRSLQENVPGCEPSQSVAAGFDRAFDERVDFVAALDGEYAVAQDKLAGLHAELERSNAWARDRNAAVAERDAAILGLQHEVEQGNAWAQSLDAQAAQQSAVIVALQDEVAQRNRWAGELDAEVQRRDTRILGLQTELTESTHWAQRLDRILGRFGALLLVQFVLIVGMRYAGAAGLRAAHVAWPLYAASSTGGAFAFLWMRRAHLRGAMRDFLRRF